MAKNQEECQRCKRIENKSTIIVTALKIMLIAAAFGVSLGLLIQELDGKDVDNSSMTPTIQPEKVSITRWVFTILLVVILSFLLGMHVWTPVKYLVNLLWSTSTGQNLGNEKGEGQGHEQDSNPPRRPPEGALESAPENNQGEKRGKVQFAQQPGAKSIPEEKNEKNDSGKF